MAYVIMVPQPETEPAPPALEAQSLPLDHQGSFDVGILVYKVRDKFHKGSIVIVVFIFILKFYLFISCWGGACCIACRILVLQPGMEPGPQQWNKS